MDVVMRIRRNRSFLSRNPILRCIRQHCDLVSFLQLVCILVLISGFLHFNRLQYSRLNTRGTGRLQYIRAGVGSTGTKVITAKIHEQWITENEQPFNENNVATVATHLIVVAGHSVTISGHLEDADKDEHDWYMLPYQKGRGLPDAIIGHISAGVVQAAIDPLSLLIFSGGQTRATTGPESEGSSYYRVADAMQLWSRPFIIEENQRDQGIFEQLNVTTVHSHENITAPELTPEQLIENRYPGRTTIRARTVTEEFATDSFENL
jgi:hypothetical protein